MSQIHIKNGRIIDPANQRDEIADLFIADGKISAIGEMPKDFRAEQTIEAKDQWVIPGLVDLSARLREPGEEYKANILSETRAASYAGITTLCIPPDTDPVIDEPAVVDLIQNKAQLSQHSKIVTLGALTSQLKGEHLSEMAALKQAGCVGISNARHNIENPLVLRRAYEYAATHNITVFIEADIPQLSNKGCAHEGTIATRLGLPTISYSAETAAIAMHLELIAETNVRAHFCRLSTARSVEMLNHAKSRGLKISADVAAHQLHLTEMDITSFNTQCHVLPPLRTQRDMEALRQGLSSGIISAICSDHQPHENDAKLAPFPATEAGISALETLLPLTLKLVDNGQLDLSSAIASLTYEPAQILGINAGTLSIGRAADICIVNPSQEWTHQIESIQSQGKNTPFLGWNFMGKVCHTFVQGQAITFN